MKIEIWSDITCPFCYIGKHHLERALAQFAHRDKTEVIWRSFELDPAAPINSEGDIYELLASKYGQSREWAIQANEDLKRRAAQMGLEFNPEKIIPTNSFDAHRLIKLADKYGKADETAERLFAAYFSEGKHIAKHDVLREVGTEIDLDADEVDELLKGSTYSGEVRKDEQEAQQIGIRGVPFFLFNRKYAISGAQPVDTFQQTLEKCQEEKHSEISD